MPLLRTILTLALLAVAAPAQADTVRIALVSLCDPAKIATLTSDRAANPRVRKIAYWLEVARQQGRDPQAEMDAVMVAVGWGGTLRGELTAKAMVRNRVIAERLGCLVPITRSGSSNESSLSHICTHNRVTGTTASLPLRSAKC